MALHALRTPGADSLLAPDGELPDQTLASKADSFVDPRAHKPNPFTSASSKQPQQGTPAHAPLGFRPRSQNNAGRQGEFTPLLASVLKGKAGGKLLASAKASPLKGKVTFDATTAFSDRSLPPLSEDQTRSEESTSLSLVAPGQSSSVLSTPLNGNGESEASKDGALLSLRQQQKVWEALRTHSNTQLIDDMKKENFDFRLRIHFMNERLGKTTPEHIEAALKENVEIKVEHASLKKEMRNLKKLLQDAEKRAKELESAIDARGGLEAKESRTVVAALKNAQSEKKELEEKLQKALSESEVLLQRLEYEPRKDVSEEDASSEELQKQIEELEADREDLEMQLRQRSLEADEREDHIVSLLIDGVNCKVSIEDQLRTQSTAAEQLERELEQLQQLQDQGDQDISRSVSDATRFPSGAVAEKELSAVREENDTYRRRCKELEEQVQTALFERDGYEQQVEELQSVKRTTQATTNHEQQYAHQLEDKCTEMQQQLESLQDVLEDQKSQSEQRLSQAQQELATKSTTLESQKASLEFELQKKEAALLRQEQAWEQKRSELQDLEAQVKDLEQTVQKFTEAELAPENHDSKALASEEKRHRQKEATLETRLETVNADLASKKDAVENLTREVEVTTDKLFTLDQKLSGQGETNRILQETIESLQVKLKNLNDVQTRTKSSLRSSDSQCQELELKAHGLQLQLQELRAEKDHQDSRSKNIESQLKIERENSESAQKKLRATEADLKHTSMKLDKLQNEYQRIKDTHVQETPSFRSTEASLNRLKIENEKLSERVQRLDQSNHSRTKDFVGNKGHRDDETEHVPRQNVKLEAENLKLQSRVRELVAMAGQKNQDLEDEIAVLSEQHEKLEMDFSDLEAAYRSVQTQLQDSLKENIKSLETIEELRNRIATLETDQQFASHEVPDRNSRKQASENYDKLRESLVTARKQYAELQKESSLQRKKLRKQLQIAEEEVESLRRRLKKTHSRSGQRSQGHPSVQEPSSDNHSQHLAEIKGMAQQIRYMKAKYAREQSFRQDLAFTKGFFLMQIASFESCNDVNLVLLEQMGIYPDRTTPRKKPSLRVVVHTIIAVNRMSRKKKSWASVLEMKITLANLANRARVE